jgi:hypothetical protein
MPRVGAAIVGGLVTKFMYIGLRTHIREARHVLQCPIAGDVTVLDIQK